MSVTSTMPAPVVQMALVEKIVEVEQNQFHVQQLVSQETARQSLEAQSRRIHESDKSSQGRKIRDQERDRGRQNSGQGSRQRADNADGEDGADNAPASNPWAGHIVDVKI
jgi:hypothetical protein